VVDRNSYVPMYQQVKNDIEEQILDGRIAIGEKLMSETEMMHHYNVGRVTIRNALAELVAAGCLRKEQGLGTFCSALPKSEERKNIDVLLNTSDKYFIPYFLTGISRVLDAGKYNLILHDTQDSTENIAAMIRQVLQHGTAGIILQPFTGTANVPESCVQAISCCAEQNVPLITIDGTFRDMDTAHVINNDEHGGFMATRHLIERGHRNILGLFRNRNRDSEFRSAGYRTAMEEAGLPVRMLNADGIAPEMLVETIRNEEITGVVCYNDYLAVQCYHCFDRFGLKVGRDVSIVGFDDTELSRNAIPRLTTVTHPKEKMGEKAAELLLHWIEETIQPPIHYVFQPDLIERDSVQRKTGTF